MNLELHIDELVLHGFDPRDRHAIGDAVQQELHRLVAERGIAPVDAPIEIPHLDAGTIDLGPTTRGQGAGPSIARAVHTTLSSNAGR